MISTDEAEKISTDLQQIVSTFNRAFRHWVKDNNCVAEFSWAYNPDGVKQIDIVSIDSIVYRRKPNADFSTIKKALEQA